jgi:hypothetical protein
LIPWLTVLAAAMAFGAGFVLRDHQLAPATPTPWEERGWKDYRFPQTRVKLSLPSPPHIEAGPPQKDGLPNLFARSLLPAQNLEFGFQILRVGPALPARLPSPEEAEQGVLRDYPASQVLRSHHFQWEHGTGVDFHLKTPSGETYRRTLFARDVIFVLTVVGNRFVSHDESIQHFLGSFQLENRTDQAVQQSAAAEVIDLPATGKSN